LTITHPVARHNPDQAWQEIEADGSLSMEIAANV